MTMAITLAEYNRRFDLIVEAFRIGHLAPGEASAAMHELTRTTVRR
jgi:hypothetical protein